MSESTRVLQLVDSWYVETKTGYDGPFESYEEAEAFARLSQMADIARMEFADLAIVV